MQTEHLHVPTLTTAETAQLFRTAGMATTAQKIAAGIEQQVYPFGVCIKSDKGARKFEIYAKQVREYIKERAL